MGCHWFSWCLSLPLSAQPNWQQHTSFLYNFIIPFFSTKMRSHLSPGGEHPSFAASEEFLNLEEAPKAQESEVQWESGSRQGSQQQVHKHKKKEDTEGDHQRQPWSQLFSQQWQLPLHSKSQPKSSQAQAQAQAQTQATKADSKAHPRLGRRP